MLVTIKPYSHFGKIWQLFLHQVKHSLTTGPKISLQGICPRKVHTYLQRLIWECSKLEGGNKCPSTGEWINFGIFNNETLPHNRRDELLIYTQTWMDIKNNTELKKPHTGYTPYDSIYTKLYSRQN